ncbi:unnamed protein product, partial [Prunus brigantina]
ASQDQDDCLVQRLGFISSFCIPSIEQCGGIILMCNPSMLNISILNYHERYINCEIQELSTKKVWLATFIYAYPQKAKQKAMWTDLISLKLVSNIPWLLLGDFNNIWSLNEKMGGSQMITPAMIKFNKFLNDCEVFIMNASGVPFTWCNGHHDNYIIYERLYRALVNPAWMTLFPNSELQNLSILRSDHGPILFTCNDDAHILYYIFNLILSIFWLIFWKNFEILNYISNIGLSTSSGAKHNQMNEFWSNSKFGCYELFNNSYGERPCENHLYYNNLVILASFVGVLTLFVGVLTLFTNNVPLQNVNHTNIALIPKVDSPETVNHYRPISLCNVSYKMITKIFVNRLRPFTSKIPSFSLLINGLPYGHFIASRRIRQGDPLSPYIFILCMEPFIRHFNILAKNPKSNVGLLSSPGGDRVSKLIFVDDCLIFARAIVVAARNINTLLEKISKVSSQKINLHKSTIYSSGNVHSQIRTALSILMQIQHKATLWCYLGIHNIIFWKDPANAKMMMERIRSKFAGWKVQTLSKASRLTIKASASGIPNHTLSCFKCPEEVYICLPKHLRGLGVRLTVHFNKAALAKLGWICLSDPTNWWAQIITKKSAYNLQLQDKPSHPRASLLKKMWSLTLPHKVKLFAWCTSMIPTTSQQNFDGIKWLDMLPHLKDIEGLNSLSKALILYWQVWEARNCVFKVIALHPIRAHNVAGQVGLDYWKINSI